MTIIDADAHVVESEKTWTYMTGADAKYRPQTVMIPARTELSGSTGPSIRPAHQ